MFNQRVRMHLESVRLDFGAKFWTQQCKQKEHMILRFKVGDQVFLHNTVRVTLLPGVIVEYTKPMFYIIKLDDSQMMKAHQDSFYQCMCTVQMETAQAGMLLSKSGVSASLTMTILNVKEHSSTTTSQEDINDEERTWQHSCYIVNTTAAIFTRSKLAKFLYWQSSFLKGRIIHCHKWWY